MGNLFAKTNSFGYEARPSYPSREPKLLARGQNIRVYDIGNNLANQVYAAPTQSAMDRMKYGGLGLSDSAIRRMGAANRAPPVTTSIFQEGQVIEVPAASARTPKWAAKKLKAAKPMSIEVITDPYAINGPVLPQQVEQIVRWSSNPQLEGGSAGVTEALGKMETEIRPWLLAPYGMERNINYWESPIKKR